MTLSSTVVVNATITPMYVPCPATGDLHSYSDYGSPTYSITVVPEEHFLGYIVGTNEPVYQHCDREDKYKHQGTKCLCGVSGPTITTLVSRTHNF